MAVFFGCFSIQRNTATRAPLSTSPSRHQQLTDAPPSYEESQRSYYNYVSTSPSPLPPSYEESQRSYYNYVSTSPSPLPPSYEESQRSYNYVSENHHSMPTLHLYQSSWTLQNTYCAEQITFQPSWIPAQGRFLTEDNRIIQVRPIWIISENQIVTTVRHRETGNIDYACYQTIDQPVTASLIEIIEHYNQESMRR